MPSFLLACLSGSWIGLSFQPWHTTWLILPGLYLFQHLFHQTKKIRYTFIAFALAQTIGLIWIIYVLKQFGKLPFIIAFASLLFLASYNALFPTLAVWLTWKLPSQRYPWLIFSPLFCLFESLRGWLFTGFPWNQINQPFGAMPFFARPAAWVGASGLSLLLLYWAGWERLSRKMKGGLLILTLIFYLLPASLPQPMEPLKIALIQPNIEEEKRTLGEDVGDLAIALKLSNEAKATNPDVLIWPESTVIDLWMEGNWLDSLTYDLTEKGERDMIFNANIPQGSCTYNGAILHHQGHRDWYAKVHLVPFGEYLPFRSFFEKLGFHQIARSVGDFCPGKKVKILKGKTHYGLSVCYEIVYTHLVRQQVKEGATLLVSLTNDAWYGRGGAAWQHACQANLRALEYYRPLARAALSGISFLSNHRGMPQESLPLHIRGILSASLTPHKEKTVYYYLEPGEVWLWMLLVLLPLCQRRSIDGTANLEGKN